MKRLKKVSDDVTIKRLKNTIGGIIMMKLKNIKGNTFWIRGGTNTGVYIFEDRSALLIDTGLGGERQERMIEILDDNNITVKYIISTHEHEDHSGGNHQIKERYKDVKIFSSYKSKLYIENPDIYMDFLTGGRRTQILEKELSKYILHPNKIDEVIYPGQTLKLNGHDFEIVDCSGHTEGCIAVITDDKVAFFADLMISKNSLEKFEFLFMSDYSSQIKSLDRVRILDFELGVLGHSSKIYSKKEMMEVADYNYEALMGLVEFVLNFLEEPRTFDELIKEFLDRRKLTCNYIAYLEYRNSLNATISYLLDTDVIDYRLDNNILKYVINKDVLKGKDGLLYCDV